MQAMLMAALSFIAVFALVPVARRLALTFGVTDDPKPGKLHQSVTPYLGGLAIALGAVATSSFLPGWTAEAAVIMGSALMVGSVGLVDDIRTLSPAPRLAVEVAAAVLVFTAGARVELLGGVGDLFLTVVWIVVLTNSFNLLDNMDGCAALVACVAAAGLVVAAGLEGQVLVQGMAALVLGGSAGFLVYNWHPARIFMGDAGSLFLGFLLATISLKLRFPSSHAHGVVAVVLLAGTAIFDTTLVVVSRVLARRPIYLGGTDHTSHRLLTWGMQAPSAALSLAGATAVCGALGVGVGRGALPVAPVLIGVAVVATGLLFAFLRVQVYASAAHQSSADLL